jgi:hypothetical protein
VLKRHSLDLIAPQLKFRRYPAAGGALKNSGLAQKNAGGVGELGLWPSCSA